MQRGRRTLADGGDRGARLDLAGLLLLAAGLGLATYGASQGPDRGWLSAAAAPAWAGGLVLITGYLLWARRWAGSHVRPPAVNLSLLASPLRSVTLALACVASVVLFAVLFLAPVFLQDVQHRSATVTGLVLLPQGIVMGLASWLGNAVVERGKARPAVIAYSVSAGLALLAASTAGLVLLTAQTPAWLTAALLCGRGVALGLTVQPLVLALVDDLDDARMPDANTLFNIAERLSGSFGIALLATFYAARTQLTGSAVTALHDCALVLAAVSAGRRARRARAPRGRRASPGPRPAASEPSPPRAGRSASLVGRRARAPCPGLPRPLSVRRWLRPPTMPGKQGASPWTPSPTSRRRRTSRSGSTRRAAPTARRWRER